ncbi:hypothetical protein IFM89_026233 [Coptis chinensis]|uniref:Ubiquitin-like domain-containing protein n=1 Tax=Coptis chinensis TaxID=261450 RepID=A0A835IFS8_9MAGN|nr:hypothetical protein IFM89_026233 [Coptis chinensis]
MVICIDVAKSVNGERLPLEPPDLNFEYANFISAGLRWRIRFGDGIMREFTVKSAYNGCFHLIYLGLPFGKVQAVLSYLGGNGSQFGMPVMLDVPQHPNLSRRFASLVRFREKRKERGLDNKTRHTTHKVVAARKLKENFDPSTKRKSHTDLNLEDDRPIDPVPSSSKATIKAKPIAHDTPLMPYITTAKLICIANCQECVFFLGWSTGIQCNVPVGEELDDGRTIASYNIEGGSTIYAVFRLGDTMLISVTTEKNRTFSLKVKRWFTVLNVKFLIESMVGIPIGKRKLWLDKVELENDMTLANLHFSEGQTLNLRSNSMQIFIRVPSGKLINYRVDGSYTVQNVQEMIEEQEGIHIRSQRLIYGAMQFEPSRSLDDYNIKEDATIHLVLRLCGC